jgi:hypothetical protein
LHMFSFHVGYFATMPSCRPEQSVSLRPFWTEDLDALR